MKQLSKFQNTIFRLGAILMGVGMVSILHENIWSAIFFMVGAIMFVSMQIVASYEGNNFTIKRLRRQQLFSDACFLIGGVLMHLQVLHYYRLGHNVWVIFVLIGALVQLYTLFRIDAELKKEQKN